MRFCVLLLLASIHSTESLSLSHGDSRTITNHDIPFGESVEITSEDPVAVVEMFLIQGESSRASPTELSYFRVHSASMEIARLDQLPEIPSSLTPIRSIKGSSSLAVFNHLQSHNFTFQLFFRVVSDAHFSCSRVVQSTVPFISVESPSNTSCALTILSISNGDFPAGVVFNSLSLTGNGTAVVVPGVNLNTPRYFFRFSETTVSKWQEVSVYGKALTVLLPPKTLFNASIIDGGVDLKDKIEVKNDSGFLTNPNYPQPVDAPINFTTQVKFSPTTKIDIFLVDAEFGNDSLTIGNTVFTGNQTGRKSTFTKSPLAIQLLQSDSHMTRGFLLRYSVTSSASTSDQIALRVLFSIILIATFNRRYF